jgi:hypothetical protein
MGAGRDSLVAISEIPADVAFPGARCFAGNNKVTDQEIEAHSRIIGCSYLRKVPWE